MKTILLAALAAATIAGGATAQSEDRGSHNPAIKNSRPMTTMDTARGRNSFTERQAQDRIGKAGYAHVSRLAKNANGVWQGKAMRRGKVVNVALDYKGDVTVR